MRQFCAAATRANSSVYRLEPVGTEPSALPGPGQLLFGYGAHFIAVLLTPASPLTSDGCGFVAAYAGWGNTFLGLVPSGETVPSTGATYRLCLWTSVPPALPSGDQWRTRRIYTFPCSGLLRTPGRGPGSRCGTEFSAVHRSAGTDATHRSGQESGECQCAARLRIRPGATCSCRCSGQRSDSIPLPSPAWKAGRRVQGNGRR